MSAGPWAGPAGDGVGACREQNASAAPHVCGESAPKHSGERHRRDERGHAGSQWWCASSPGSSGVASAGGREPGVVTSRPGPVWCEAHFGTTPGRAEGLGSSLGFGDVRHLGCGGEEGLTSGQEGHPKIGKPLARSVAGLISRGGEPARGIFTKPLLGAERVRGCEQREQVKMRG